jgi:hypothetical protein
MTTQELILRDIQRVLERIAKALEEKDDCKKSSTAQHKMPTEEPCRKLEESIRQAAEEATFEADDE